MAKTPQKRKKRVSKKDERVKIVNLRFSITELGLIKKYMKEKELKTISPLIRDTVLQVIRHEYLIIENDKLNS